MDRHRITRTEYMKALTYLQEEGSDPKGYVQMVAGAWVSGETVSDPVFREALALFDPLDTEEMK